MNRIELEAALTDIAGTFTTFLYNCGPVVLDIVGLIIWKLSLSIKWNYDISWSAIFKKKT